MAVSDATDVVFQSDPFAHIHDGSDLVFSGEVSCIGCNTGNKYWVRNLYGSDVLKSLSHESGSCSGFTMGGGRAMGSYLRRMADEIERKLVPRLPAMAHDPRDGQQTLATGAHDGAQSQTNVTESLPASREL